MAEDNQFKDNQFKDNQFKDNQFEDNQFEDNQFQDSSYLNSFTTLDLTENDDIPLNAFDIIHISNRSDIYHLTRQVLIDSVLTQDTYCFFYHILTKTVEEFNQTYGSFAYLVARDKYGKYEADLYLNVDPDALDHIINYIQTTKINITKIKEHNPDTIEEIIDLATMFGMPNLVSILRTMSCPEDEFRELMANNKKLAKLMGILWKIYQPNNQFG